MRRVCSISKPPFAASTISAPSVRVADERFTVERGVSAKNHRKQKFVEVNVFAARVMDLARGLIALPGYREAIVRPGDHEIPRRHLVERECACLVRADSRRRTKRLNSRQAFDDGVLLGEFAGSKGQQCRHHGWKACGNTRDGESYAGYKKCLEILSVGPSQEDDPHNGKTAEQNEDAGAFIEFPLQGCLFGLSLIEHAGDLPDLRGHPGASDDHLSPPSCHRCVHEGHVDAVT